MNNENNTDKNRQPDRHANQDKSDHKSHLDQQAHDDKSPRSYDSRSDDANQEEEGKGKIATSSPGGSKSEDKRL